MKDNHKKILTIFISAVLYSLLKYFLVGSQYSFLPEFVANFVILLGLAFLLYPVVSIFVSKKLGFLNIYFHSFFTAMAIISISVVGNITNDSDLLSESKTSDKYKKIVNENNPNPIKKVGDVKHEFLNEDNLYENYVYNYAIKFPEDFELNYGVGEYSQLKAYNKETIRQIAISSGDNKLNYSLSNQQANDLLKSMMERDVDAMVEKMKLKWKTEGSYQNIELLEKDLVNFYNKKFIKLSFSGTRNLNNIDYAFVMTDFITLFKTNIYQFLFESPKPKDELDSMSWENLLFSTMAGVRISEGITQ